MALQGVVDRHVSNPVTLGMAFSPPDLRALLDKAGGPVRIGRALGITSNAVSMWRQVPARHVHNVAALAGVPSETLRPDMFKVSTGMTTQAAAEAA